MRSKISEKAPSNLPLLGGKLVSLLLLFHDRQLLYLPSISGNYHGLLQLKQVMRERHGMEVLPVSRV